MFFETHCHLDYLKAFSIDEILEKAGEVGVKHFMTIAVTPDNLDNVIKIANSHDNVYCTQGIHPHDAKLMTDDVLEKIKQNSVNNKKVKAIGECGLDYHYDNSPRDIQKKVFEMQLQLACDLDLPVVIHTRDADEDTIDILKNFTSKLKKKAVLHSFTSGKKLAEFAINEGLFIGFNGILTFKSAENVREIADMTPVENILFETDSPFLTPVPHRGKENGPYFLHHVAKKVAEIKDVVHTDQLYNQVFSNSTSFFDVE